MKVRMSMIRKTMVLWHNGNYEGNGKVPWPQVTLYFLLLLKAFMFRLGWQFDQAQIPSSTLAIAWVGALSVDLDEHGFTCWLEKSPLYV